MSGHLPPQERIAAAWNTFQLKVQAVHKKALQILHNSDEAEREKKLEDLNKHLS